MLDTTATWVRWCGFTLIGVWLLWGAFAWAQDLGTAQIELMPPHPTPNSGLVVRLFGDWRDSCIPMAPQLSIVGSEIRIETSHSGGGCLQWVSHWELFVSLGQLPVGHYHILVTHTAAGDEPEQIGQAEFAVQPITGGSAIGVRLRTALCMNRMTRQMVRVEIHEDLAFWNCQSAGLVVRPGDVVDMVVSGSAE